MSKLKDTEVGRKYLKDAQQFFNNLQPRDVVGGRTTFHIRPTFQEAIRMVFGSKGAKITFYEKGTMHKIKRQRELENQKHALKKDVVLDEPVLELIPDNDSPPQLKKDIVRHKHTESR